MIIDLHLTKEILESPYYDPRNSLSIQLDIFEKELDNAIVTNVHELVVIHGIGEGVLKKEVHKLLKKHPLVSGYSNEYNILYGMGSTKITFK